MCDVMINDGCVVTHVTNNDYTIIVGNLHVVLCYKRRMDRLIRLTLGS